MIRDAAPDDLESIVAIYNAAIATRESTADTEPVTPESRLAWLVNRDPGRRPLWVLEQDGEVAAWLAFKDFYGRPAYHATAEIGVYVHTGRRRRGAGRALVRQAIERSPELGVATLLAVAFARNEPSRALFEGEGFEPWGLLPGVTEIDGTERDVVILGRRVPAAAPGAS